MIKKADILLFVCLLLFGIAVSWLSLSGSITGEKDVYKRQLILYRMLQFMSREIEAGLLPKKEIQS